MDTNLKPTPLSAATIRSLLDSGALADIGPLLPGLSNSHAMTHTWALAALASHDALLPGEAQALREYRLQAFADINLAMAERIAENVQESAWALRLGAEGVARAGALEGQVKGLTAELRTAQEQIELLWQVLETIHGEAVIDGHLDIIEQEKTK